MKPLMLMSCCAFLLASTAPALAHETTKTTVKTTKTTKTTDRTPKTTQGKVVNKDRDADVAVSTTRTTSAVQEPRRDVIESRAEERRSAEGKHFTFAPMFGYATNGFGLGVGARFGYTFATPVYVGGNFMYHAGESGLASTYYPGAEIGYDIGAGPVLLRPYGGFGAVVNTGSPTTRSSTSALFYPGFTVHYLIPRSPAFVGGDARLLVPTDYGAAISMTATTGLNF